MLRNMITRHLEQELHRLLKEYPCITLLGPRQAGKTTLARTLAGYDYVNLELPEQREFATTDPKAFLARFEGKVILDEIQRVPALLSYIQVEVDRRQQNGQFVMTGSHQLELRAAINQSLAGRTALLHLYPFSMAELQDAGIGLPTAADYIFQGFLPRIYDQHQRPIQAYSNYYQTYVERDVRQLINLKDQNTFENFLKLLAGRAGQLMDYQSLANDVGISATTIKNWLSVLEASYIVFKLPPYFNNFGKRVIKAPKYYFVETGLLSYLLGIEHPQQVARDPLIGQLFENLVISECLKAQANRGKRSDLYFFLDSNGNEIDLLLPQ
ncbi:MAG: ATP-binding protein, partial [Parahaliea sp.]